MRTDKDAEMSYPPALLHSALTCAAHQGVIKKKGGNPSGLACHGVGAGVFCFSLGVVWWIVDLDGCGGGQGAAGGAALVGYGSGLGCRRPADTNGRDLRL